MADLLFPLIVPQMRERRFCQQEFSLDEFSDEELRSRYRFGSQSIEYLTEIIGDDLQRQTKRNHAITPTLQILVSLRFLASGSFLQVIGDTFGLPKSTVSRTVTDVTLALAHKQSEFIVWPSDPVEMHEVKRGFSIKEASQELLDASTGPMSGFRGQTGMKMITSIERDIIR